MSRGHTFIVCALHLACLTSVVHGALSSGSVTPKSQLAGRITDVDVVFATDAIIPVGEYISVQLPDGFVIDATASALIVDAAIATTLTVASLTTSEIQCRIETTDIAADSVFQFTISQVTNPASGETRAFSVSTIDTSGNTMSSLSDITSVTITPGIFDAGSVVPDSTQAGVVGTASVTFTSGVGLPVGSLIVVTFPSGFDVASTTLSSMSNLDASSSVAAVSSSVVQVSVSGSAVVAGASVSFKVNAVTNGGAMTTSTFSLESMDSAGNVYESLSSIDGVTFISGSLTTVSVASNPEYAGVLTVMTVGFTSSVQVSGGFVVVVFPVEFMVLSGLIMRTGALDVDAIGITDGQSVSFPLPATFTSGSHTASIASVTNPGVTTTGSFVIYTADEAGRIIEAAMTATGVTTIPGPLLNAQIVPDLPHPGVVSNVLITFTTSASLTQDCFIYLTLPAGDYDIGVVDPSAIVVSPSPQITVDVSWDDENTALLIVFTSSAPIAQGSVVSLSVTALLLPPSVRLLSTAASIETWNGVGLRLDGPTTVTLSSITAVSPLPVTWKTFLPRPGVSSEVSLQFDINGALPSNGQIQLDLANVEFSPTSTSTLSATFSNPSVVTATTTWDAATSQLLIKLGGVSGIAAYSSLLQFKIRHFDTPPSARLPQTLSASLTTLDAGGTVIDGPSSFFIDAITPGTIAGTRMWNSSQAYAGVTSDQTISFSLSGKLDVGCKFEFVLPSMGWNIAPIDTMATFISPALTEVGGITWDSSTRKLEVTLGGSIAIPSNAFITFKLSGISNPPKETGVTNAYLTTKTAGGSVVDGPGAISIQAISRGALSGPKTFRSTTTTGASMKSNQLLTATLSGGLPSGSRITLSFPSSGWRLASAAPDVFFVAPAAGVSVAAVTWAADSYTMDIVTSGDLAEGTAIQIQLNNLINPYHESAAETLTILTRLVDSGIVDESTDVDINAITSPVLLVDGVWTSTIQTPGIVSTQTVTMVTGGSLEIGARICIGLPIGDQWTILQGYTASITVNNGASSALITDWSADTYVLCVTTVVPIPQESEISIRVTNVRSPPSERPTISATVVIHSHLGGQVNTGSLQVNTISKGSFTDTQAWQNALYSPGPVAGLETTATWSFSTSGQISSGGRVLLVLPIEWALLPSCGVVFVQPAVGSIATCSDNTLSIQLFDTISEHTAITIRIAGVINPNTILAAGLASANTFAPDGGIIDESTAITTGAIESALIDITSPGDTRVAVVGVSKTFFFQGFSLGEGDVIKFMDWSTTSDANCGTATSGVSDVGGIDVKYLGAKSDVELTFPQSSPDNEDFVICYKFGSNPFKLYREFAFTVKEVLSYRANVGATNVAVANYEKIWKLSGRGIAEGDLVRWVNINAVTSAVASGTTIDCTDVSILAKLTTNSGVVLHADEDEYTRRIDIAGEARLSFSANPNAGQTFSLCYKFGNEPYRTYPSMTIHVRHVRSIVASSTGSDSVAIVDAAKKFKFIGEGILLNDRVYFIEEGTSTSCEPSTSDLTLQLEHTVSEQSHYILFVSAIDEITVNFTVNGAGKSVVPCYQFGDEPYQLYPDLRLDLNMILSFAGTQGSPLLAVAHVPEPLTFRGFGVDEGDAVRWIHEAEEDCESNLASLIEPLSLLPVDTITLNETYSAAFNFSSTQVDYHPVLCYKFGVEAFKLYRNLALRIGSIRAKTSSTGAKDIAVVGARKFFTLYGTNLDKHDRVAWSTDPLDGCNSVALLIRSTDTVDEDFVSYITAVHSFGVAFAGLNSGMRVFLCYGFGTEPYRLYSDLYVDVKSIHAMRTLRGSNTVAVAGALKTIHFQGDGVATGDFAKFVYESNKDCSAPGIPLLNYVKEFDDETEMSMYLYENIDGVTVGGFTFSPEVGSAGLGRVLCYRFGSEPYFFYEYFQIDVKTIWALRQPSLAGEGQNDVAVVNEPKMVTIDGVGFSSNDHVKWVNGDDAKSDQDCEDLSPQGLVGHNITVFENGSMWYPFDYGSNGSAWQLCYKFDDEPYRLYPAVSVSVKEITGLLNSEYPTSITQGEIAIVGLERTWRPMGSGIQAGDSAKFVPLAVETSDDCGVGSFNTAGGSSVMEITGEDTSFAGMFTLFPAALADKYHLCYKFQDEPYTYVQGITISTYGIVSIDRTTFLVSAATPIHLSGFRLSNQDQLGWVTKSDAALTGCSSAFGISDVIESTATVIFEEAYDTLQLCYSFGREPFILIRSVHISVVIGEIWLPDPIAIVAEQVTDVNVTGTFGLTISSDQVAWIPSDEIACSTEVISTYSTMMLATVVSSTQSESDIARAGSATIRLNFVPPTASASLSEALSTWKLCYRFGNRPEFLMFGSVLCEVLTIESVSLVATEPSATGTTMKFLFEGIGLQDFDLVKWVLASKAVFDEDCDTLLPIGGSSVKPVIAGIAAFDFFEQAGNMNLCYQFSNHPFKLFGSVPIADSTAPAKSTLPGGLESGSNAMSDSDATTVTLTPNQDVATVTLTLEKDINDIPSGSAAEASFKASFTSTLSISLGIDPARIQINEILPGSVIVKFQLLPSQSNADPLVNEILDELQAQLATPTSLLLQNGVIAVGNPETAYSALLVTSPGPTPAPAVIAARGYQRSGLFSFTRSAFSVTEKTGMLQIRVQRLQGTSGVVSLPFQVNPSTLTAVYNTDFRFVSPSGVTDLSVLFLTFSIGEREKFVELEILDNNLKQGHFKMIQLVLGDPGVADATLGAISNTAVYIYDFDDGDVLAQASFPLGSESAETNHQEMTSATLGWTVIENGETGTLRVDASGLFAVDAIVGDAEYNQKCDMAAPMGACSYSCEVGASLATRDELMTTRRVVHLHGTDYVATTRALTTFPASEMTLSFWIRTTHTNRDACILSYAIPVGAFASTHVAVCDPTNLHLLIDVAHVDTRGDGSHPGLATFIDVSDGQWHFVAITWNADDGRVHVFDNGMLAFDGGPYRVGFTLQPNGFLVLGQFVASASTDASPSPCTSTSTSAGDALTACATLTGRGLEAELQHIYIWARVLGPSELHKQLAWPLRVRTNKLVLGWNFDAAFVTTRVPEVMAGTTASSASTDGLVVSDLATQGQVQAQQNTGMLRCLSASIHPFTGGGAAAHCLVAGVVPSISPGFPCGIVYANLWQFAAPSSWPSLLAAAYGGRLQFRMLAPSANGSPRVRRGQISIRSSDGTLMSVALRAFALPNARTWTYYSVVLREDFGWLEEPSGQALDTSAFQRALRLATALYIRGDLWGPSALGQGEEVVYLNDIKLFAR